MVKLCAMLKACITHSRYCQGLQTIFNDKLTYEVTHLILQTTELGAYVTDRLS